MNLQKERISLNTSYLCHSASPLYSAQTAVEHIRSEMEGTGWSAAILGGGSGLSRFGSSPRHQASSPSVHQLIGILQHVLLLPVNLFIYPRFFGFKLPADCFRLVDSVMSWSSSCSPSSNDDGILHVQRKPSSATAPGRQSIVPSPYGGEQARRSSSPSSYHDLV